MDKIRDCKFKLIKKGIVLSAAGLMALSAVKSSAWFTDRAGADAGTRTAFLDFSLNGHAAECDLSEEQGHLLSFQKGESFRVIFRTAYNGNTDCYCLPRLRILSDDPGAAIELSDGTDTARSSGEETMLTSAPEYVREGDSLEFIYTVTSLTDDNPMGLRYEFSLAAAQMEGNQNIIDTDVSYDEIFDDIRQKNDMTAWDELSDIYGFTACTGPEDVWDLHLQASPENGFIHAVELRPELQPGNSPAFTTSWFLRQEAGEQEVLHAGNEDARLILRLSGALSEAAVRYELANEAGISASPVYKLRLEGGEIAYEEQDFDPIYH